MTAFDTPGPYLINDRYKTDPAGRFLDFLIKKREEGAPIVGLYCGYAPLELIRAVGATPVSLCASSQRTVAAAEAVLPANLCPLIKSSFGFISTDSCPIFALSQAVIGETTCDGKKKMFELISHRKPIHVMDLPNMPEGRGVGEQWLKTVEKLKEFLEETFQKRITAARLEDELRETNRKSSLIDGFFDCLTRHPPPVRWEEIYDVIALDPVSTSDELHTLMEGIDERLKERIEADLFRGFLFPPGPGDGLSHRRRCVEGPEDHRGGRGRSGGPGGVQRHEGLFHPHRGGHGRSPAGGCRSDPEDTLLLHVSEPGPP